MVPAKSPGTCRADLARRRTWFVTRRAATRSSACCRRAWQLGPAWMPAPRALDRRIPATTGPCRRGDHSVVGCAPGTECVVGLTWHRWTPRCGSSCVGAACERYGSPTQVRARVAGHRRACSGGYGADLGCDGGAPLRGRARSGVADVMVPLRWLHWAAAAVERRAVVDELAVGSGGGGCGRGRCAVVWRGRAGRLPPWASSWVASGVAVALERLLRGGVGGVRAGDDEFDRGL